MSTDLFMPSRASTSLNVSQNNVSQNRPTLSAEQISSAEFDSRRERETDAYRFSDLITPPMNHTLRTQSGGEILLDYIDTLRSEKLRAFVDNNIEADTLIDEFFHQSTAAIELFTRLVNGAQLNHSEKAHIELAKKRTANGLEWLKGLL